ncbi:hypothetical protein ACHHYP_00400 [Achlya hypogyna]|uniref:Ubiquitin-like domain-containing protein n=1 Tax=Achlya hypogyna TaxID=1202772 RepID=A0A1V9ZB09_ACHHY|nr:hypothetical protein ACHHYP_00400 [Achlya hypogyna]
MDLARAEDWELVEPTERTSAPAPQPVDDASHEVAAGVVETTLPLCDENEQEIKATGDEAGSVEADLAVSMEDTVERPASKFDLASSDTIERSSTPIRIRIGEGIHAHHFREEETVGEFMDQVFATERRDGKRIRLISKVRALDKMTKLNDRAKGALMLSEKRMTDYHLLPNDVVHAIITDLVAEPIQPEAPTTDLGFGIPLRTSDVLLLLTGLILLLMWLCYGQYPQAFNGPSFAILLALSVFHAYCVYSALMVHHHGR